MPKAARTKNQRGQLFQPYPSPENNSPLFTITCLYIGQGDCILIQCPDGQNIMIDCGSTAGMDKKNRTKFVEGLKTLLSNNMIIHYLILTHSDADHHNKVSLLKEANLTVNNVLLGDLHWYDIHYKIEKKTSKKATDEEKQSYIESIKNMNPVDYWDKWAKKYTDKKNKALEILKTCGCKNFIGLTLNKDKKKSTFWSINQDGTLKAFPGKIESDNSFLVARGTNWSIKILAAEVESVDNKSSVFMNTASLVTLLEIGNERALFTGDSTGNTFTYLQENFSFFDPSTSFALLQIPHHGSSTNNSSSIDFINKTRPKYVFTSVKIDDRQHRLPRWDALKKWKRSTELKKGDNKGTFICYWVSKKELQSKRIGSKVNSTIKSKDETYLTDNEIGLFLRNLNLKAIFSKENEYILVDLKNTDKTTLALERENAKDSLFVLYEYEFSNDVLFFVLQKTKKAIITNGTATIQTYLHEKFISTKERPIKILRKDLISTALNQLTAAQYILTETGIQNSPIIHQA